MTVETAVGEPGLLHDTLDSRLVESLFAQLPGGGGDDAPMRLLLLFRSGHLRPSRSIEKSRV